MKYLLVAIIAACGSATSHGIDLDGDGRDDCWNVDGDEVTLRPSCQGDTIAIAPDDDGRIALPKAIDTRAWRIAIARLLVPDEHVECETKGPDCTGDAPALAGQIERRSRPLRFGSGVQARYTPRWYDGVPVANDEAFVLDPSVPRDDDVAHRHEQILDDTSIWLRRVGPTPIGGLGGCASWGLVGGQRGVIAVDQLNGRWTWISSDWADVDQRDTPACVDDLVILVHYCCTDSRGADATDPRTGLVVSTSIDQETPADFIAYGHGGYDESPTLRQIAALASGALTDPTAPCATTAPLLAMPDGPPCTLHGTADIDGVEPDDCWTAQREGTRDAGTLSWQLELQYGCTGDPQHVGLQLGGPVSGADFYQLPKPARSWLAHEIGGDRVACVPARKGCPAPPPAARWAAANLADTHAPVIWQDGIPALEAPSVIVGKDTVLTYQSASEEIPGTPPSKTWSCDRWDVWTAPAGGAIVDRHTHRWAWLYLATEDSSNRWPDGIVAGRCDDRKVTFELASKREVTVDPATGAWAPVDSAR